MRDLGGVVQAKQAPVYPLGIKVGSRKVCWAGQGRSRQCGEGKGSSGWLIAEAEESERVQRWASGRPRHE